MSMYFAYDPNGKGFVFCYTLKEAKKGAEDAFQEELDAAYGDEWDDNVETICYGQVLGMVHEKSRTPDESGKFDEIVDYELVEIK